MRTYTVKVVTILDQGKRTGFVTVKADTHRHATVLAEARLEKIWGGIMPKSIISAIVLSEVVK